MTIETLTNALCAQIARLPLKERVNALNRIRRKLHDVSPFRREPADLVLWANSDEIQANDYNPNHVAPPEMRLLQKSLEEDGYTQPIVVYPKNGKYTVVDGFHRLQIGKKTNAVKKRVHSFLPITEIRPDHHDRISRIASTLRHNRARGAHEIALMVKIVAELVEAGMSDAWIRKNIGMEADELLRLKQVSGLATMFKNQEFSMAWAKDGHDAAHYWQMAEKS